MYKHILFPTDGSAPSSRALVHAVQLAAAMGAKLTGLYVKQAPTPIVFEGLKPVAWVQPDEHAAMSAKAAATYLGAVERTATKAGVACECVAVDGEYPADAILELARKRKCDVIVMASHGRRGLQGILLGSETQRVLAQAKVPVLVCR